MNYDAVQSRLFRIIDEGSVSALEAVRTLIDSESKDPQIRAKVVASLLSVSLDADSAGEVLERIVTIQSELSTRLGRDVDLRVAAMEYAVSNPDVIAEPVVVDQELLELSQRLAAVDELTGLYNRRFLDIYLAKELHRAKRHGTLFSVVFLDLDDFKAVNDAHGHDVGDSVLAAVSHTLLDLLRAEDFAARYGGEEFVVVLPHTDSDGAMRFYDRFSTRLARVALPARITMTASGGIATYPEHAVTVEELLRTADAALYQSKQGGKAHSRVARAEQRTLPRYPAELSAICFVDDAELGELRIHEVSARGVSALGEVAVEPGQTIRMRIRDGVASPNQELSAQVVWSRQLSESVYRVGGKWSLTDQSSVDRLIDRVTLE